MWYSLVLAVSMSSLHRPTLLHNFCPLSPNLHPNLVFKLTSICQSKAQKMERPKYKPPMFEVSDFTGFVSARRIAAEQNERLARKMDAAKIIDEINSDAEAIRDYYYAPKVVPSFRIRKQSWDNQCFHFRTDKQRSLCTPGVPGSKK